MKKILLLSGVFLVFVLITGVSIFNDNEPKPLKVYQKDGVVVKSYDYNSLEYFLKKDNDTTYVINFWATWCVPCVEELPSFEKLNAEYRDKKVKVILVSLDISKQIESRLIPFMQKKKLQSKVVLLNDPDANAWIEKVDKNWSGAIPATIIYKKQNRKFYERSFTYEELEKEVNQFN
ncbi:thiol-disulfide isomerase/thioredoxin [Flavobacterium arsenatis]|uniref:Thiol-disulfide isomerase/thioredoxin n=1 Tax=Flavobacterium arsenatis TaxID=1484332 RepID=A0ABU1TPA2_9FLAO|nr:redoxin domain-containing protein [Flavobacterium arsenatis]MDR6967804.1 thiol-disulfide isomerase/thioredoxin [Flavobacterium arsenatis]